MKANASSAVNALKGNALLKADLRRMFTTSRLWIFLLTCLVVPILILTMTTAFGSEGESASMPPITSAWSLIGSTGGMTMDMTAMMNINLVFFAAGIFLCLFVADDFRSGYAKNLFTVHAAKGKYVTAKTVTGILAGALMLCAFFIGTMLGGAFAGLSFSLVNATAVNVILCLLAKMLLMGVMIPIFLATACFSKGKSWMSILLSLFIGMLLFMIIPMMSPLNTGIMQVVLCAAGSVMFTVGLSIVSKMILSKEDLV